MNNKLQDIRKELRRRMQIGIHKMGAWLRSVLQGHYRYYAVPRNSQALSAFRYRILVMWKQTLSRRSHKAYINWDRMNRYADRWLPSPRILHPYPRQRLCVNTRGRSPVR